jgi:hypothetical protein
MVRGMVLAASLTSSAMWAVCEVVSWKSPGNKQTITYRINTDLLADTSQLSNQNRKRHIRPAALVLELAPNLVVGSCRRAHPDRHDVREVRQDVKQEHRILPVRQSLCAVDVREVANSQHSECKERSLVCRKAVILVVDQDDRLHEATGEEDAHGVTGLPGDGRYPSGCWLVKVFFICT